MNKCPQSQNTGGANVLIRTSAMDADGDEDCLEFLTTSPPQQSNVLLVTYLRTPDEWLQTWLEYADTRLANLSFIHMGETTRSAAAASTAELPPQTGQVVQSIENPSDLTGLGIAISEQLAE